MVAAIVGDVFATINRDPANLDSWRRLFMLPRCILGNPPNGNRLSWREILKKVRSKITRWQAGDVMGLWSEVLAGEELSNNRRKKKKSKLSEADTLRASNVGRAKRAIAAGQYRKGLQALSSEGLAPATPEVLEEMLSKHPQSPLPLIPSSPAPPPISIKESDVVQALRSFPSDSAPGPSLFRANHFKEAVHCPTPDCGNKALIAITRTVNLLCTGEGGSPTPLRGHSTSLP